MRYLRLLTILFLLPGISLSQVSQLIPSDAGLMFSVDLGRLTKSMSINEMDDYTFIQEFVRDFSGSNQEGVSLKDLGVDLNGSFVVFAGEREAFSYMGMGADVKNKSEFMANEKIRRNMAEDLKSQGYYQSDRQLALLNKKTFSSIEIDWNSRYFRTITDSIFDANKWERPYDYFYDYEEFAESLEMIEMAVEEIEDIEETEEIVEVEVAEEATEIEETMEEESMYDKYERILDSVRTAEKEILMKEFYQEIIEGDGLISTDNRAQKVMNESSDASFFMDPERMNRKSYAFYDYNPMMDQLMRLSDNVWQSAHLTMTKEGMTIDWMTHGDEKVMKVAKAGLDQSFDSDLIKYVPSYSQGVIAYNFNMFGAYNVIKETYMPILDKSEDPDLLLTSAIWSTIDEIVDEKTVTDIYGANMLLSFNGMKEMTLTKTTYDYDEETFEYTERKEEYQDLLPVMTWAISTDKAYLLEKYMKAAHAYANEEIIKHEGYYEVIDGPMGGTPFYLVIKEEMIIVTNDKNLVQDHLEGYSKGLDKERQKALKEAKFIYAQLDMEQMPKQMLNYVTSRKDRQLLEALEDKTGEMEISFAEINDDYQKISASFKYDRGYKNGIFYLMDVIDDMMNMGKE